MAAGIHPSAIQRDNDSEVIVMLDHTRRPYDGALGDLDEFQRRALFVAQLQTMPDDWARVKVSWRDVGRVVREELFSAA